MPKLDVTHRGGFTVMGVGRLESGIIDLTDSALAPFIAHPLVREMVDAGDRIVWLDKPEDVDAWLKAEQAKAEAPELNLAEPAKASEAPKAAKRGKAHPEDAPPPPSED